MRLWVGVAAAGVLAAALSVVACPAWADDEPDPEEADSLSGSDLPTNAMARFLLFSGSDLWRAGGFSHAGMTWSPGGLDHEGFTLKLTAGAGAYRFISGALGGNQVVGRQISASVLPGWRFKKDKLFVTVFAGLDLQRHVLTPDDPSAGLRGNYFGLRSTVEVWFEPTEATMATADFSVSTIGWSYSGRAAFGARMFGWFYLGPEVAAFQNDGNYRQFRAGAHLTGLRFDDLEWTGGFGWATDTDRRASAYGKLGVIARR